MTIKTKAITTVCISVCLLCASGLAVAYVLFRVNFSRLEHDEGIRQARSVSASILTQAKGLDMLCRDWAQWDETHEYVLGKNPEYVTENLQDSYLDKLNLELLAIVEMSRNVVFSTYLNSESRQDAGLRRSVELAQLKMIDALPPGQPDAGANGLVELGDHVMMLSCVPITPSSGQGAIAGWLFMGRLVCERELVPIENVTGLNIDLTPITEAKAICDAEELAALKAMLVDDQPDRVVAHGQKLTALRLLNDYAGEANFLLKTTGSRTIYSHALSTAKASLAAILIAGIVVGGVCIFAMTRQILNPISRLNRAMQKVIETGQPTSDSDIDVDSDGEIGQLGRSFASMMDSICGAEKKLRDAMDQAQKASKLKSNFLSMISHEIRTPLNGIIGLTDAVLASDRPDEMKKYAREINTESDHLLDLINTLLDNARIEAGKMEIEALPVRLEKLMQEIVSHCNGRAVKKKIKLNINLDPDAPDYVLGDALRLKQILLNLVTNAIKFTEQGSIDVSISRLGATQTTSLIRFEVADTGIGIAPEDQKHIFESFAQVDNGTTRKFGGTGLGTTISWSLVNLMGGEIKLESELGHGSRFWFDLEMENCGADLLDQLDEFDEEPQREVAPPADSADILVVEDYPINQDVVRMHLECAGHRVTIASDGLEGVKAAAEASFDLVLMDLQMPNMDGIEATRRIRKLDEQYAAIPIIALSANTDVDSYVTCIEAGMNDYLSKPIRRRDLLAVLNRWLSKPEADMSEQICEDPGCHDAESMANAGPVDIARAVEEFCGSQELVLNTLKQFVELLPRQVESITQSLEQADLETVAKEAHKIKGGAANLAADPLAAAAADLEFSAKGGDLDASASGVQRLDESVRTLIEFARKT